MAGALGYFDSPVRVGRPDGPFPAFDKAGRPLGPSQASAGTAVSCVSIPQVGLVPPFSLGILQSFGSVCVCLPDKAVLPSLLYAIVCVVTVRARGSPGPPSRPPRRRRLSPDLRPITLKNNDPYWYAGAFDANGNPIERASGRAIKPGSAPRLYNGNPYGYDGYWTDPFYAGAGGPARAPLGTQNPYPAGVWSPRLCPFFMKTFQI